MAQEKIKSYQLSDTGVTPGTYSTANLTVDSAGRLTFVEDGSGGGGASFFDILDKVTSSSMVTTTNSPNDFLVPGINVGEVGIEIRGPVVVGASAAFDQGSNHQSYRELFYHTNPVSNGFTWRVVVERQPGSEGMTFLAELNDGLPNFIFIEYYFDEFIVNSAGNQIHYESPVDWFPTDTTSVTFDLIFNGTNLDIEMNSVPLVSGLVIEPLDTITNVYLDNDTDPGDNQPTFTEVTITGVAVSPVTSQIDTSPTNSSISFPNLRITAGSPNIIEQQPLTFTDAYGAPETYMPYPFASDIQVNPIVEFKDGFSVSLDGDAKEKLVVSANRIESTTLIFNSILPPPILF